MLLLPMTKGQSFRVYKVDKKNIVGFLEDTFPGVKEIKEETRMKYVGSPIKKISDKGKQTKRGSHPTPNSQNKRVILGRKNQLIRMMKKTGTGDLLKSRYLRIN